MTRGQQAQGTVSTDFSRSIEDPGGKSLGRKRINRITDMMNNLLGGGNNLVM